MTATDWLEDRLEQRRRAARARLAARQSGRNRKRRAVVRDLARLMLVASLLMLGVLAVEIGRKATVVLNHMNAAAPPPAAVLAG